MENLNWRKSTRSANGGETCVELARTPRSIAVRDSKDTTAPYIEMTRRTLRQFLTDMKQGKYDL
jgi:hypothetical protein